MTSCIGITDTAWYVANKKIKHVPQAKLVKYYESKANGELQIATVKKVYRDNFKNAWAYSVSFFKTCAEKVANVPPHQTKMAAYCMQNQLIARISHGFRTSGASKQRAYQYFQQFTSKIVRDIIDRVYAGKQNRVETQTEVWQDCMKPL